MLDTGEFAGFDLAARVDFSPQGSTWTVNAQGQRTTTVLFGAGSSLEFGAQRRQLAEAVFTGNSEFHPDAVGGLTRARFTASSSVDFVAGARQITTAAFGSESDFKPTAHGQARTTATFSSESSFDARTLRGVMTEAVITGQGEARFVVDDFSIVYTAAQFSGNSLFAPKARFIYTWLPPAFEGVIRPEEPRTALHTE